MSTTAEKIAVMQAHDQGEQIEFYSESDSKWSPLPRPAWDWIRIVYRVKPKEPVLKTVKMLCFLQAGTLRWLSEARAAVTPLRHSAVRIPAEDKVITYSKEQS